MAQFHELEELVQEAVDLTKLVHRLSFGADELEKASLSQPKLYMTASRYRTQVLRSMKKTERKYKTLRAEKKQALRKKKHSMPRGERPTESSLEDLVDTDFEVRKLAVRLDRLIVLEEFAKSLVDSFRQRRDMIRNLIDIRNAEIGHEIRSVKQGMAKKEMDTMRTKARQRMRDLEVEEDD